MLAIASRRLGRRLVGAMLGGCLSYVPLSTQAASEHSQSSQEGVIPEHRQTPQARNNTGGSSSGGVDDVLGVSPAGRDIVTDRVVASEFSDEWFDDHFLTGDWFGHRKELYEDGLEFHGSTVTDLLANVTGGFSQGWEPAASTDLGLVFDLEKLIGWPGAEFHTNMIWRVGNNLSATRIGNLLTVAQLYGGQNLRLYSLYLKQSFLEDDLYFKVGRFGAFDDFLASPINWNFINNGFDGNPKGIFFNVPPFGQTVYPTASWGAFVKYEPQDDEWYIQGGAYALSERNGRNASSGINFGFDADRGVAGLIQGGYMPNQNPGDEGLPGKYSLGLYYESYKLPTFSVPREEKWGLYGGYLMAEQMVYREPGEENLMKQPGTWGFGAQEGLTLFSALVYTPQEDVALFPVYLNSGFTYQGPIPGRPQDFVAGGITVGITGDDIEAFQRQIGVPVQTYEAVFELNYRVNITNYFYIQPGMQYVVQPNANGQIPDALVLGGQIGVIY